MAYGMKNGEIFLCPCSAVNGAIAKLRRQRWRRDGSRLHSKAHCVLRALVMSCCTLFWNTVRPPMPEPQRTPHLDEREVRVSVPPKKCAPYGADASACIFPATAHSLQREAVHPHLCLFSALNASVSWPRPACWRAFFPDTKA